MAIGTTAAILGGIGAATSGIGAIAEATKSGPQAAYSPEELARLRQQEQAALAQQEQFAQALAAQGGVNKLGDVYGALGQVGMGPAPDIAGAQLAQATGQNVANQAALMAGQRGAAANPALMARQAAMQGGALQQQAAGQAQALRLQQEEQQQRLRLAGLQGQANIAGNLASAQGNMLGNITSARQGSRDAALRDRAATMGVSQQASAAKQQTLGGMASGLASAIPGLAAMNQGGRVPAPPTRLPSLSEYLAQSPAPQGFAYGKKVPGRAKVKGDNPKNDYVPALLSPGEIVVPRSKAKDPKKAANFAAAVARRGGR